MRRELAIAAGLMLLLAGCGGGQAQQRPTLVEVHSRAPDFAAPDQHGEIVRMSELRGKPVVLYFYPKDGTPGCTEEACAFRDAWERLRQANAQVVGVSTDTVQSHRRFARKHDLCFPLLADPQAHILDRYGVPRALGMAQRVTFIIDRNGYVRRVFRDVDPAVHVEQVLRVLRSLEQVQPG